MPGDNGMFWAVSLACQDGKFLIKWRHALKWEDLPRGPLQYVLAVALQHWDDFQIPVDWPAYQVYLAENEDEDEYEERQDTYVDLLNAFPLTPASKEVCWTAAEQWIQGYHLGMAIDRARSALVAGNRASAFEELLGLHEVQGKVKKEPVTLDAGGLGEILRRRYDPELACPTGIRRIDDLWEGGVYPGDLAMVVAPTNVGKSMLLAQLAIAAYRHNKRVLYFTYELTREQVTERILTGIFTRSKHELDPDKIDQQLLEFREELGLTRGSLVIDDGEDISTVADLKRRLEEEDIDLVLLDSADDLNPKQKYDKLYEAQGAIYTDLRRTICQGMGIPVWTSSQLNRESVEKAKVSLKQIGDSFKKVQRAHLVLAISQTRDEEEFWIGPLVKLWVLKDTVHGSRGKWDRYYTAFGRGFKGWPGFNYYAEKGDLE